MTILILAVLVRFIFSLLFLDLDRSNYFEYGDILINILSGNGYSLAYTIDNFAYAYPSAYMMPGYVFFLFPFFFITDLITRNMLIVSFQTFINIMVILISYKFALNYFTERTAIINVIILSFLPEFVYASQMFNPTIFYHLGVILVFYYLQKKDSVEKNKSDFIIGLISAGLIYFRGEFLLFIIFVICVKLLYREVKSAVIIFSVVILCISPWQIRNYYLFNDFVPLTTSSGLNFYRGHNPYSIGDWGDKKIFEQLIKFKGNDKYEIEMNGVYFNHALESVKDNPGQEIINTFKKIYHLWISNPNDERTSHAVYFFPWLFLLVCFLIGIIKTFSWSRHKYSYLFFIYSTVLGIVFFALPRYQTMMKILVIPFSAYGIEWIIKSVRMKKIG